MFLIESAFPPATVCFPSQRMRNTYARSPIFPYPERVILLAPSPTCPDDVEKKMRRSVRLFKSVPILLIGSDADVRMFSE
jgi:hypothetical protein